MGIYWIAGAVIRSIQMLLINRHMDKVDLDDLVKSNLEKAQKKREKKGLPPQKITNQAHQNVRNINHSGNQKKVSQDSVQNNVKYKEGSLSSKANLVKQYDEKNKKK
jgi:YidC/Oxa1 family membrane protein insertase